MPERYQSRTPFTYYDPSTNEYVDRYYLKQEFGGGFEESRRAAVTGSGALSGRATRPEINALATDPRPSTIAGENEAIPLLYGTVTIGPKIPIRRLDSSGNMVLMLVWCIGEIDAIVTLTLNGSPIPASVQLTHYLGTSTQTADPTLAALIPGYTDSLVHDADGIPVGIAYSVAVVPPNTSEGFPEFVATIRGKLVYDPRVSNDVHSSNPSLILADFNRNVVYGLARAVDETSLIAAANENDALVGTLPRRTLNLVMDQQAKRSAWIKLLAEYAGVFMAQEGAVTKLIPDRPGTSVATVTENDMITGSVRLRRAGMRNRPTVMRVSYTDITGDLPVEAVAEVCAPGVKPGTVARRESNVSLPGIDNFAEANRHAIERLNYFQLTDLTISWQSFDDSLALLCGEIISISHPLGLSNREFRLTSISSDQPGRYLHEASEYNVEQYSNDTTTAPGISDTTLPDPSIVPMVTGLIVTETVAQLQTGVFFSRITATWNPVLYPYSFNYRMVVQEQASGAIIFDAQVKSLEISTAAIQEGVVYVVSVSVVAALGYEGMPTSTQITALGKFLVPSDVPQFTATRAGVALIELTWLPAVDLDIRFYEIRLGAGAWEQAVFIDRISAFRTPVTVSVTNDTLYTYQIRAIDSVQQYSANAAFASVLMSNPGNVPVITGDSLGGQIRLQWTEALGYVSAYEIRFAPQTGGFAWETATLLDRISALAYFTRAIPEGDYTFYIKALDGVGGESAVAATFNLTIVLDKSRFFVDTKYYASTSSLTNMASYRLEPIDPNTYYVTDDGATWNSKFPALFDTYTNLLFTYHGAASSQLVTNELDFGDDLQGAWGNNLSTIMALSGSVSTTLELSLDQVIWDPYPANVSNNVLAQYSRLQVNGGSGDTVYLSLPGISTNINVQTFQEIGFDTTTSSGPHRLITLERAYGRAKSLSLTIEGDDAYTISYQNLTLGDPTTFEVLGFNTRNGNRVVANFSWNFEGV